MKTHSFYDQYGNAKSYKLVGVSAKDIADRCAARGIPFYHRPDGTGTTWRQGERTFHVYEEVGHDWLEAGMPQRLHMYRCMDGRQFGRAV